MKLSVIQNKLTLGTCAALMMAGLSGGIAQGQSSTGAIPVKGNLVEAIDDNRISAGADGILFLDTSVVEEGKLIRNGQVIAMIDPEQAELNLELKKAEEEQARLQAENDVRIRAAEKSLEFEVAEARAAEDLHKKGAMPYWDMRREVLEAENAKLSIELAENEQKVAEATYAAKKAERRLAEHEIKRREITASFDGIIATRYGKNGEWVQAGTPVVHVVRVDEIKVEGDVDGLVSPDRIVIGAPVSIRVRVGQDKYEEFQSTLEYVSPILQGDKTYRVWAKIKNRVEGGRFVVSPGMQADMEVLPATRVTLN